MTFLRRFRDALAMTLLATFATATAVSAQTSGFGIVNQRATVYASPAASGDKVRDLQRNDSVELLNNGGPWFEVEFLDTKTLQKRRGFIEARLVNVVTPFRPAPPPPPKPELPNYGGVKPLDDSTYTAAIKEGESKPTGSISHSPLLMRALLAREEGGLRGDFFFVIYTPFTRVATAVATAKERYESAKPPSVAAANAGQVQVLVRPGNNFSAGQSIQRVVVKRGGRIIEATKSDVTPQIFSNALGAKRELNTGVFTFPFDAFAPGELTIVLIGSGRPLEWVMRPEEVAALR